MCIRDRGATAILCASDGIARGVLAELRRLGLRVPGDVSVMGYDNDPEGTAEVLSLIHI